MAERDIKVLHTTILRWAPTIAARRRAILQTSGTHRKTRLRWVTVRDYRSLATVSVFTAGSLSKGLVFTLLREAFARGTALSKVNGTSRVRSGRSHARRSMVSSACGEYPVSPTALRF